MLEKITFLTGILTVSSTVLLTSLMSAAPSHNLHIKVNNQELTDQQPVMINNTVLVPIRTLSD